MARLSRSVASKEEDRAVADYVKNVESSIDKRIDLTLGVKHRERDSGPIKSSVSSITIDAGQDALFKGVGVTKAGGVKL